MYVQYSEEVLLAKIPIEYWIGQKIKMLALVAELAVLKILAVLAVLQYYKDDSFRVWSLLTYILKARDPKNINNRFNNL